jgi:hypothetical protein
VCLLVLTGGCCQFGVECDDNPVLKVFSDYGGIFTSELQYSGTCGATRSQTVGSRAGPAQGSSRSTRQNGC